MKKFSKVKYFGAVAAALLAVAPIAAPVVSQVASPVVVQADGSQVTSTATVQVDGSQPTQGSTPSAPAHAATTIDAQKVLNYFFKDSTTLPAGTPLSTFVGEGPFVTDPTSLQGQQTTPTRLLGSLLTNTYPAQEFGNYYAQIVFSGYEGYSAGQVAADLTARGAGTYTATVYLFNANSSATNGHYDTPALASKTVTLTVPATTAAVSGVSSVSDATVAIGSSVTPFKTLASIIGSTKFALSDGSTRAAVPSDFLNHVGFTQSSRAVIDPQASPAVNDPHFTVDDGSVTGPTFTTPGTYYDLFELSDAFSNSLTNAHVTPTVSLRKNDMGNWYVARKVVVSDYSETAATGTANVVNGQGTTVYSDPTTTTSTGKTLDYGSAWKVYSVVKNSAGTVLAYNLGGKQYVKASDVSSTAVSKQAGVFTVKYPSNPTWSIAVYNSDLKVQKLIPAGSTWMTFGVKTLKDGKSYYNVGGDQWVRTDYGYWNAK